MKKIGLSFLLVLFSAGVVNASVKYTVPTHQRLFEEALTVLQNDGYSSVVKTFKQVDQLLMAGLRDADEISLITDLWLNWDHGMDPWTHQGFSILKPSAGQTAEKLFWKAVNTWRENPFDAAYQLGLAIHRLEDVTFTGHSNTDKEGIKFVITDFNFLDPALGHLSYEAYMEQWLKNFSRDQLIKLGFLIDKGGIYNFQSFVKDGVLHCDSSSPFGWVDYAAHQSYDWLSLLKNSEPGSDTWENITKKQFILCQRIVAGFLVFFWRTVQLMEAPIALTPSSQPNNGWPMYGANSQHTNSVPYIGKKPKILWKKGDISGWPVVNKERIVYVAGSCSKFYALKNGLELWHYKFNDCIPSESPALDNQGNIYVSVSHPWGLLYSLRPNGTLRWWQEYSCETSPIIDSLDRVIVCGRYRLSAFETNGDLVWQQGGLEGIADAPPVVGIDGTIYVTVKPDGAYFPTTTICAFDNQGNFKWQGAKLAGDVSKIVLAPDALYVTTHTPFWEHYLFCLETKDGKVRWKTKNQKGSWLGEYTGLSVADNNIYATSYYSGMPFLQKIRQGIIEWEFKKENDVSYLGNRFTEPIVDGQGLIYIGTNNLEVYAIEPTNGLIVWKYHPPFQKTLSRPFNDEPPKMVLGSDSVFYIVIEDTLYALGSDNPPVWQNPVAANQIEPVVFPGLGVAITINSPDKTEIQVQPKDREQRYLQIEAKGEFVSVDLAISYDPKKLAKWGIDENKATLAFSDDNGASWHPVETLRDAVKQVLYALGLSHLSLWTIIEGEETNKLTEVSETASITAPPLVVHLFQNYPNPFNQTTAIRFELPKASEISLEIYNALGQKISDLAAGYYPAGGHLIIWNAEGLPSGIYFYRLKVGDLVETKKAVILK